MRIAAIRGCLIPIFPVADSASRAFSAGGTGLVVKRSRLVASLASSLAARTPSQGLLFDTGGSLPSLLQFDQRLSHPHIQILKGFSAEDVLDVLTVHLIDQLRKWGIGQFWRRIKNSVTSGIRHITASREWPGHSSSRLGIEAAPIDAFSIPPDFNQKD